MEYQPKADMRTGRISGVEALVRWHAPRKGVIRPDAFIPKAERSAATLKQLTEWTLNAAMRQARAWQLDGNQLTVAVNLSPSSVLDSQLVEHVGQLLSK